MRGHDTVLMMIGTGVLLGLSGAARAVDSEVIYSFAGQFDLRIPAAAEATKGAMEDAVIEVPVHLIIEDLDVSVSITHTSAFDLQLSLVSPSGTAVVLNQADPFEGFYKGANYSGTVFDDEATTPIENGLPPFSGRYRPLSGSSLAAFDGEDAYGSWHFQVADIAYGDWGTFHSFQLTITTPEPVTAVLLLGGLVLARRRRRHRGD
jgi:subtilisin-like proprotein convertase family protein